MDKEKEELNKNIYVLEVDMENRTVEDIAKDAAMQIIELFDRLVEQHKNLK